MTSWYSGPDKVNFREGALDHLLNEPSGDVGRYLRKKGELILLGARGLVGVRTGALRASLHISQARRARSQEMRVGSDIPYALVHHEGAKPHVIVGHGGRTLRFVRNGRVVHATRVNHPGFRGRKYLTIPLKRVIG